MKKSIKKIDFNRGRFATIVVFAATFAAIGGIVTLLATSAAVALVVDPTIPQPRNVRAFGDDRTITVQWDSNNDSSTVGYYITYKPVGASTDEGVRQTVYNMIQLQPVENDTEYEITVQSARGGYAFFDNGPLDSNGFQSRFARANGRVSSPSTLTASPSSARVEAQRQRLTGFFDDFNVPANPFDETKWNTAATHCSRPNSVGSFINSQFHAHNMVASGFCDRAGVIARARGVFNTTGRSATNPALIEFDVDGISRERDSWYVDIIPTDVRTDRLPIDLTSQDTNFTNPKNMIRVDQKQSFVKLLYYPSGGTNGPDEYIELPIIPSAACPSWGNNRLTEFMACNMSQKTGNFSPLAQPTASLYPVVPNVRRHWVIQLTDTRIRVFIDNVQVMEAVLPAEFASKQEFTVHNTTFSYNTGKQYNMNYAFPSTGMIHFDNFGFTGPADPTIVHNYLEGGADGNTPHIGRGTSTGAPIERGARTTVIPVPDPIGDLINDQARLMFTLQDFGWGSYRWSAGDHVIFNNRRYDFVAPASTMPGVPIDRVTGDFLGAVSAVVYINRSDILQGDNTVQFNIIGANGSIDFMNVHLELPYARNDTNRPVYTQPIQIFGQDYSNLVQPAMTNCDVYNFIEQDIDLPLLGGRDNLEVGSCFFMPQMVTHNPDFYGGQMSDPPPTADTTAPTVQLTAPANNTTVTGTSLAATATANDNIGVTRVDFLMGGIVVGTDNSSPYEVSIDFTSLASGSYAVSAVARDAAGNIAQTSAVTVVKPQAADTTAPITSITSPGNNTTLAQSQTTLSVSANATDSVGVTRVNFYVDDALFSTDNTAPYETVVNIGSLTVGNHNLYTRAYDSAGNMRQSSTVIFTIPAPPPATCPVGQTGTPPNCITPPPPSCPEGQTGTPPNCILPSPDPIPTPSPGKPGDINGDGRVGLADLRISLFHYGRDVTAGTNGDLNNDGKVNLRDLRILLFNYGK